MAFRGYYEHSLDAKGRLTVPAKFRPMLATGLVLAKAFEPCISVWAPQDWEQFTNRFLASLNPFSSEGRRLQRYFNAGSFDAELDSAGRLMVPQSLIEHASVSRDVTVVGNMACFEIWDRKRWRSYERDLDKSIIEDAEKLSLS